MKELTIEEKAIAYDEAIRKAKDMLNYKEVRQEDVEYLFPELKESEESEDKKIRKAIIDFLQETIDNIGESPNIWTMNNAKKWIAWLENQGEQKPAWSEENEMFVHGLIRGLSAKRDIHGHTTFSSDCIDITETINWLKSLKDRVQLQNRWKPSEEQLKSLQKVIDAGYFTSYPNSLETLYEQLKQL